MTNRNYFFSQETEVTNKNFHPRQGNRSKAVGGTKTVRKKLPRVSHVSKSVHSLVPSCPHILPMSGGHVAGAPKINPDIGQVVFKAHNKQQKFIRYSD